MKRWNSKKSKYVENKKVDAFIEEVIEVCKKHGFSIGQHDAYGLFEIEKFNEQNAEWLRDASDET